MQILIDNKESESMPNLKGLSNNRVNRRVREVIENGEETIFVYEPSVDDVERIIELQDIISEKGSASPTEVVISGNDVVRRVFPMLTNIEGISELSNEEIEDIIANPSIALLQVQHVIETIITQIYKTVILSAKKQILEADFDAASLSALDGVLSHVAGLSAKNEEAAIRTYEAVKTTGDKVISLLDKKENTGEAESITEVKIEEETPEVEPPIKTTQQSPVDKYSDKLNQYLADFAKKED